MTGSFSSRNYYTENGTLLLAKGSPITIEMLGRLKQYKGIRFGEADTNLEAEKRKYQESTQRIARQFKGINEQTLHQVNSLLIRVIFQSKQKSWWMYVNALSHYLDWLYTHSIDVAMISLLIGVEMNYAEKALWELGLGALLHDVGKLLIPKRILQKLAPLNPPEKMILGQHCELGMDALAGCSLPEASTNIIIQHHERLDGSGYPCSLKGEQISEYTQIVMIADVFDAITAGRPYKKSKGPEDALLILNNQSEKFSKEFLEVLEAILRD